MPIVTPQVPQGLVDLMKGLAKEVIREKPENIYEFAANYFEKLLMKRDGCMDKGYEKFTAYEKLMAGTERYVLPSYIRLNCARANAKVSAPLADSGETRNMPIDNQKYVNAIYVIQRYVRRYLFAKRAKEHASTENTSTRSSGSTKNTHTAAIIIQRCIRKVCILKQQKSDEKLKKETHNVTQDDDISEAGSKISSSTVQMMADINEATNVNDLVANSTEFESSRSNGSEIKNLKPSLSELSPQKINIKPKTEEDKGVERPKVENFQNSANRKENKDTSTSTINIGDLKSENSIGLICSQNLHEKANEIDNSENISKHLEIITTQSASCSSSCSSKQTVIGLSQIDLSEPYSQKGAILSIHTSERRPMVQIDRSYELTIDPNTDESTKHRMYEIFYQEDKDDAEFSDSLNESTIERDSLENTISKYTDCEENDNDYDDGDDDDDDDDENDDNDSEDSDSIDGRSSRKTYRVLKISPLDEAPCIGGDNFTETRHTSVETKPVTYNYEVARRRQRKKKEKSSTAFIIPIEKKIQNSTKKSGLKEVKTIQSKIGERLIADVKLSSCSTSDDINLYSKDSGLKTFPNKTHSDLCEEEKRIKLEKRKLEFKSKITQQNQNGKSRATTSSAVSSGDIIGKIQKFNIRGHLSKEDQTNLRKNVSHIIRKSKNRAIRFKSKIPLRIEQKNSKFSYNKTRDAAKTESAEVHKVEFEDGSPKNKQTIGEVDNTIEKQSNQKIETIKRNDNESGKITNERSKSKEICNATEMTPPSRSTPSYECDQKLNYKEKHNYSNKKNEVNEICQEGDENRSEKETIRLRCDQINEMRIAKVKVIQNKANDECDEKNFSQEVNGGSKLPHSKAEESAIQLSLQDLSKKENDVEKIKEIFQNYEKDCVPHTSPRELSTENGSQNENLLKNFEKIEKTDIDTSELISALEKKIENGTDNERKNEFVTRNCQTDPNENSFLNKNSTLIEIASNFDNLIYLDDSLHTIPELNESAESMTAEKPKKETSNRISFETDPDSDCETTTNQWNCSKEAEENAFSDDYVNEKDEENEKFPIKSKSVYETFKEWEDPIDVNFNNVDFPNVDSKEKIRENGNEIKDEKKTLLESRSKENKSEMEHEAREDFKKFNEKIVESTELAQPAEKVENGLEKLLRDTKYIFKNNSSVENLNNSTEKTDEKKRSLDKLNANKLKNQQQSSPTKVDVIPKTDAHLDDGNENGLKNILKVAKDVLKLKSDGLSLNIRLNPHNEVGSLGEIHASESEILTNIKGNDSSKRNNISSDVTRNTEKLRKAGKQEKEFLILHSSDPNVGEDYYCTEQKNDLKKLNNSDEHSKNMESSNTKCKTLIRRSSTGDKTKKFENQEKEIFSSFEENQLSQPDSKDYSDLEIMECEKSTDHITAIQKPNSKFFYLENNKEATTQLDALSDSIPAIAQIKLNSEKLENNENDCNQECSVEARTTKTNNLCQSQAAFATQKAYSIKKQFINKMEKSFAEENPKFEELNKIENISQNNLIDLENMKKLENNKNENTFLASDQSDDCKAKIKGHTAADTVEIISNNPERNLDEKNCRLRQVENDYSELSPKTIHFDKDHNHERQLETTLPDKYDDGLKASPLTKAEVCETTTGTLIVDAPHCRNNLSILAIDAPFNVDSVPASDLQKKLTAPSPNINSETPAPVAAKFICTSSLFGDELKKNFSNPKPSDEIVLATGNIEEQSNGKMDEDRLDIEMTEQNINTNDCAQNDDYTFKLENSNLAEIDLKKNSSETEAFEYLKEDDDGREKDEELNKTQLKTAMDDETIIKTSTQNDANQNKNLYSEVKNENPKFEDKQIDSESEIKEYAANLESDIYNELENCADNVKVNTISLFHEIDKSDTSTCNSPKPQADENKKTDSNQNMKTDTGIESEIDSSKKSSFLLNETISALDLIEKNKAEKNELGSNSKTEDSFGQNNCEKQNEKNLCELKGIDCKDDDMTANILNSYRDKVEIEDTLNGEQIEDVSANAVSNISSVESANICKEKFEKIGEETEKEIISKTQEADGSNISVPLTSIEKSSICFEIDNTIRHRNEHNEDNHSENNEMIGPMEKDTSSIEERSTESNETVEIIAILSDFINAEGKDLNSEVPYEVLEEVCEKKTFSLTTDSEIDDSGIEAVKVETSSNEPKMQSCTNEITDPLDAMTEKLRETEKMVQRMQQRRASETKVNTCGVDNVELLTEQNSNQMFEEPGIMPMCELQSPNSTEEEDNNEIIDHKNTSESGSSVQSDNQKMQPQNNVNIDASNTKTLLKSVTIDEIIKYIDPSENGTTTTTASGSSLCLDDDTSENIRQKMMAYSLSEADSDFFEATTGQALAEKLNAAHDDSNIDTVLGKTQLALSETSTDTDTTTASAATRIQAGARGFLTRRRLRHASYNTKSLSMQENNNNKSSFGNDAINESLERLIEDNAARKIQKAFRHYHREMGVQSSPSTYAVNSVEQKGNNDGVLENSVDFTDVRTQVRAKTTEEKANPGKKDIHEEDKSLSSFECKLAARRQTLQRGDALRNDSVHEDEQTGAKKQNESEVSVIKTLTQETSSSTSATVQIDAEKSTSSSSSSAQSATVCNSKKIGNMTWFALRQNSMPVQIDSEVFRVIPKHMRKRIRSAETEKKKRVLKY